MPTSRPHKPKTTLNVKPFAVFGQPEPLVQWVKAPQGTYFNWTFVNLVNTGPVCAETYYLKRKRPTHLDTHKVDHPSLISRCLAV